MDEFMLQCFRESLGEEGIGGGSAIDIDDANKWNSMSDFCCTLIMLTNAIFGTTQCCFIWWEYGVLGYRKMLLKQKRSLTE